MKKRLSLFLILAMLISTLPLGVFALSQDGDVYLIGSAQDLVDFADMVNSDPSQVYNARLTADIDMDGITEWTPIGTTSGESGEYGSNAPKSNSGYKGTFDGAGYTISNLNVTKNTINYDSNGYCYGLLFQSLNGYNADYKVKDFTLKDSSLTIESDNGENRNVFAAGIAVNSNCYQVHDVSFENVDIIANGNFTDGYIGFIWQCHTFDWWNFTEIDNVSINSDCSIQTTSVGVSAAGICARATDSGTLNIRNTTFAGEISGPDLMVKTAFVADGDKYAIGDNVTNATTYNATLSDYFSIDTPEELDFLTKAVNAGSLYTTGTVYINKDLDMKGITDFQAVNHLKFTFDFQNHTVSNLVVDNPGNENFAGLLANTSANGKEIKDLKLYNCKLISNVGTVGIVMGKGDRTIVKYVEINNVTVEAPNANIVGGVIGERAWGAGDPDMSVVMNDVIFNLGNIPADHIGYLVGKKYGGDSNLTVKAVTATTVQINSSAEGFNAASVGAVGLNQDSSNDVVYDEGYTPVITLATAEDPAVGYRNQPYVKSASVTLTGEIGLNFNVCFPVSGDYSDSYMEFSVGEGTDGARSDTVVLSDARSILDNGVYYMRFTCWLNAAEMAQTVKATFYYDSGNQNLSAIEYSVKQYVEAYEDYTGAKYDAARPLVKALADYGHYAQIALSNTNGWVIGDLYEEMDKYYETGYDIDAIETAVSGYGVSKDFGASKVTNVSYSLSLDSKIAVNFYLTTSDGSDPDVTVTFNGKNYTAERQGDGRYKIKISNIPIDKLDDDVTVTGDGGFTVTASALAYVNAKLGKAETTEGTHNAMAALYKYYEAANDYVG